MTQWTAQRVADAAGASLIAEPADAQQLQRFTIDSRQAARGTLFVGLPGQTHDGGAFAGEALAAGAWGVLVAPEHAHGMRERGAGAASLAIWKMPC